MKKLIDAQIHKVYQVKELQTSQTVTKHLNNLGLIPGSKVVLIKTAGDNGILLLHNSRIAVEKKILEQIMIEEVTASGEWLSLDQLKVGESAKVLSIHGEGAVKRRLMDMGLTKNVRLTVRKLAPLGDPIEINLRGYELTLRKSEAAYILVEKEEV